MDNVLFRCHSLGNIMTNGQGKENQDKMGKTATSYLKKMHRELIYGRRETIHSKYLTKGLVREDEAIQELSVFLGYILSKNTKRLTNDYLTGEPDAFEGDTIIGTPKGFDTKCSWSLDTFPFPEDPIDKNNEYQAHGYMDLTGAEEWVIAHVLLNAPAKTLIDEKYRLARKYGVIDIDSDAEGYKEECIELEKNMIFDLGGFIEENPNFNLHTNFLDWEYDIPMNERIVLRTVKRDENIIKSIHNMIDEAREYLQSLTKKIAA